MVLAWFHKAPVAVLAGLTVLVVVGMLYFGLRLKGYRPENGVTWLPKGEGLAFDGSAVAYTEEFFEGLGGKERPPAGLTIEMLMSLEEMEKPSFRYILSVHGGLDKQQLLIGQWRRWLIFMNGDDYDGKQGVPKIYVDPGSEREGPIWLSVVAEERGTSVFVDGRLAKFNANLHLTYPSEGARVRLVLGNSVYGKHGWRGVLRGVALYARPLERAQLQAHYDRWAARGVFELDRSMASEIFYRFEALADGRVMNQARDAHHLEVPALMRLLKKEYLQWPRFGSESRWHIASDMALNLAGFAPLGFMLVVVLHRLRSGRSRWLTVIGAAFLFSLSMEMAQAWIPSRDSSLLDLILNTSGAGLGGWLGLTEARR